MNRDNLDWLNLAIKEINPNATYQAGGVDNIIWMDGTTPISQSDIEEKITDIKANGTIEENKKASGKQKLLDLGLSENEVKAMIGI